MAHITEFSVEALAGRKDLVAEKLDRHVNVIFGQNGSGKTSLLKILHSAMVNNAKILKKVPFHRAEVKIYSINYDKVFTLVCDKKGVDQQQPLEEPRRLSEPTSAAGHTPEAKEAESELKWREIHPVLPRGAPQVWRHRYLPTTRLYLSERPRREPEDYVMVLGEEQLEAAFVNLINTTWSSYSANILGLIQKVQADGLADILRDILGEARSPRHDAELDPAAAYDRVARFLERQGSKRSLLGTLATFQTNYSTNAQLRNVVSDINNVELRIQEATAPRQKLESTISNMFTGNKKVVFKDASIEIVGEGDAKIELGRLSSGEQQLLRILIDVLLAEENSFILDEPELSMYVDWQHNLIATMRQLSPKAQLILATHSPEIMADVKDENIFRL